MARKNFAAICTAILLVAALTFATSCEKPVKPEDPNTPIPGPGDTTIVDPKDPDTLVGPDGAKITYAVLSAELGGLDDWGSWRGGYGYPEPLTNDNRAIMSLRIDTVRTTGTTSQTINFDEQGLFEAEMYVPFVRYTDHDVIVYGSLDEFSFDPSTLKTQRTVDTVNLGNGKYRLDENISGTFAFSNRTGTLTITNQIYGTYIAGKFVAAPHLGIENMSLASEYLGYEEGIWTIRGNGCKSHGYGIKLNCTIKKVMPDGSKIDVSTGIYSCGRMPIIYVLAEE